MARFDQQDDSEEPEYGSLTVEDDTDGTTDPADLAGTAGSDDDRGPQPAVSEADDPDN
jgi:hypothetical protein